MSNGQIYDLVVILLNLTITALIFLAAFKKLPVKGQEAFDSINPFKPTLLKVCGVILFINVALQTIDLINS